MMHHSALMRFGLLSSTFFTLALGLPAAASADVYVGGSAHVGGAWVWGASTGHDYNRPQAVGQYDAYGRPVYYAEPPAPAPVAQCGQCGCCGGCACPAPAVQPAPQPYYPPAPQPYYPPAPQPAPQYGWYAPAPAPYQAPPPMVVAEPEPEARGSFGIGLRGSSTFLDGSAGTFEGSGGGLMLRLRGDYLALELDVGGDEYYGVREDTRVAATLYWHLTKGTVLVPYALVSLGINGVDMNGVDVHDGPDYVQGYGEIGGGAAIELGDHWMISADLRLSGRSIGEEAYYYEDSYYLSDDSSDYHPPRNYAPYEETGAELRLAAMFFF